MKNNTDLSSVFLFIRKELFYLSAFSFFLCLFLIFSFRSPSQANDESPFELHGALSVEGTTLTDSSGQPFLIQGVSMSSVNSCPEYLCSDTLRTLRDRWHLNTVRLPLYTASSDGYCYADEETRQLLRDRILNAVSLSSELGLYVILDWHILSDYDPNFNKETAVAFFSEISASLSACDNVLYEICNEPNSQTTWTSICNYAVPVIDAIRANDPNSVIIIGTPNWSQDVDEASYAPIDRPNLLYSLHFYANTNKDSLRSKAETAIANGLPLIVSEFGISDSSGNGELNFDEGDLWLSFLNYYKVGYVMWNLSNKNESCSLLRADTLSLSDWTINELSDSGLWYYNRLTGVFPIPEYTAAITASTEASGSQIAVWPLTEGCTVQSVLSASWTDGGIFYSEYDFTICNTTSTPLNGWRLRMEFSGSVTPSESWSCSLGQDQNSWLFIPKDYNTVIPAGSFVDFGMIVTSSSPVDLISVRSE